MNTMTNGSGWVIIEFMEVIFTILALSIVVFIHEMGHLLAAKYAGVGVYEFSVGMGPKLAKITFRGTIYSLRLLPIGGFVKLAGLDDEKDKIIPDNLNFRKKSLGYRALIISAGSIMNLILGYLIFFCLFFFVGMSKISPEIEKVIPSSPASRSELLAGDKILTVNGGLVEDVYEDVIKEIASSGGAPIKLTIERDGDTILKSLVPELVEGNDIYRIGISLSAIQEKLFFTQCFKLSAKATWGYVTLVFKSMDMLISGEAQFKDMTGPVGIVQFASFSLKRSMIGFFEIIALITISLGVINLFPFPVLDGGHLFFLGLEKLRGKPVSKRVEEVINGIGVVFLLILMMLILFNDIFFWKDRVDLLDKL
jgi:regulator of sigma E protease